MTEKADASPLLANVCRTMPYTAYVGVSSYAIVFRSLDAASFFVGLLVNEAVNHLAKAILKKAGPSSSLLKRPEGAADTGIYPQHHPTKSTTSGMPSGHAQTSAFCAVVLTHAVWDSGAAFPLCYIWSVALLVMVSRTRFGGILAVSVGGKRVAQHTVLQVLVGAILGCVLGHGGVLWWKGGAGYLVCFAVALQALFITIVAALLEEMCAKREGPYEGLTELEFQDKRGPGQKEAQRRSPRKRSTKN
uniref:Phosphatidic acid phosphatase type 2/haloperoxidase domain-containing protein n=1 Tax=Noctiluca scintillans TaxID=2966 RepID=A0A7S1A038_NOCSC